MGLGTQICCWTTYGDSKMSGRIWLGRGGIGHLPTWNIRSRCAIGSDREMLFHSATPRIGGQGLLPTKALIERDGLGVINCDCEMHSGVASLKRDCLKPVHKNPAETI